MAQPASKVSPNGPKWAHLGPLLRTLEAFFGHLGRFFVHVYAFLLDFREHLCIFNEKSWENHKNTANCNNNNEYCTKHRKGA